MESELPPPVLVEESRGLQRLLEDLQQASEVAVDTESDSFYRFREKVCLVQITVAERDYIIDPLAGLDISPLGRVLADPRKLKVFHDGEYDIVTLKRDWRFEFRSLFDTRVAEAALGVDTPGLASVLKARFGIELDKSMQRSNWGARPLTDKQVRYARLDTHYLLPLMKAQRHELEAKQRAMIVEGECERLEELPAQSIVHSADDFARISGARLLDPHAKQRLRELYRMRLELAEALDLPQFKVLGNEELLAIARSDAHSAAELERRTRLSPRQVRKLGDRILDALARAREAGALQPQAANPAPALDDFEYELHERLKNWRKERALAMRVESNLVLNRHVLVRLAQRKPATVAEFAAIEGVRKWQVESFGEELTQSLRRWMTEIPRSTDGARRRRFRGRRDERGQGT